MLTKHIEFEIRTLNCEQAMLDCSQSLFFLVTEFNGPPSWSLDASETGESTKYPWVGVVELIA